jgi:hypothetical protein
MPDKDYNNRGAFWRRKPKEGDEDGKQYPNYEGRMTVDGKVKWVSLWVNTEPKILERFKNYQKGGGTMDLDEFKKNQPDMSFRINEPVKKE